MNQNDLNNTQVLNMDDVEEIAKYEKAKSRKPAIMLAFAGVFAIVMGFVQPMIMKALDGGETASGNNEQVENSSNATTTAPTDEAVKSLNCTYSAVAGAEGTDTNMTVVFNFKDSKLQNFTKTITVIPTTGKETLGATTVTALLATYQNITATQPIGYALVSKAESTGLTGTLTIDLTTLNKTTLPAEYATNVFTSVNYEKDATIDAVKAAAVADGYTCQ